MIGLVYHLGVFSVGIVLFPFWWAEDSGESEELSDSGLSLGFMLLSLFLHKTPNQGYCSSMGQINSSWSFHIFPYPYSFLAWWVVPPSRSLLKIRVAFHGKLFLRAPLHGHWMIWISFPNLFLWTYFAFRRSHLEGWAPSPVSLPEGLCNLSLLSCSNFNLPLSSPRHICPILNVQFSGGDRELKLLVNAGKEKCYKPFPYLIAMLLPCIYVASLHHMFSGCFYIFCFHKISVFSLFPISFARKKPKRDSGRKAKAVKAASLESGWNLSWRPDSVLTPCVFGQVTPSLSLDSLRWKLCGYEHPFYPWAKGSVIPCLPNQFAMLSFLMNV